MSRRVMAMGWDGRKSVDSGGLERGLDERHD